jgi:hypothetical protein
MTWRAMEMVAFEEGITAQMLSQRMSARRPEEVLADPAEAR